MASGRAVKAYAVSAQRSAGSSRLVAGAACSMLPRSGYPATTRLSASRPARLAQLLSQVELRRFELLTPCVQSRCSPSELQPRALLPQPLSAYDAPIGCSLLIAGGAFWTRTRDLSLIRTAL